jgi:hypothetical protein
MLYCVKAIVISASLANARVKSKKGKNKHAADRERWMAAGTYARAGILRIRVISFLASWMATRNDETRAKCKVA